MPINIGIKKTVVIIFLINNITRLSSYLVSYRIDLFNECQKNCS